MERMSGMHKAPAWSAASLMAVSTCAWFDTVVSSVPAGMQPGPQPTTIRAPGNSSAACAIVSATACCMPATLANESSRPAMRNT